MKKILMFTMIGLFAMGLVAAVYVVNSFVITTDVIEPFEVTYAILGDAGNWDGVTDCDDESLIYEAGTDVDVGGLYAGEGRKICARINNLGEGDVDYTFSGEIISGEGNLVECTEAFGNPIVTGTALGSQVTYVGQGVVVADDAAPVENCKVTLSVARGIAA